MTAEDLQALYKASAETEPEKLENLPIHALQSYRKYFFDVQQYVSDVRLETKCRDRIQAIEREIELRRIEEKAERRHQEAHGVGKKTLSWSRVAGVTGIAAVIVAVVALIYSIYFSKVQPAASELTLPPSSSQNPRPTNGSPEPEASSNSAMPSPEQEATAQPSVSPLESNG